MEMKPSTKFSTKMITLAAKNPNVVAGKPKLSTTKPVIGPTSLPRKKDPVKASKMKYY